MNDPVVVFGSFSERESRELLAAAECLSLRASSVPTTTTTTTTTTTITPPPPHHEEPDTTTTELPSSSLPVHIPSNDLRLCYQHVLLQPRGLVNRGNLCFMSSVLQSLMACAPIYHLFMVFHEKNHRRNTLPHILTSFGSFAAEFRVLDSLPSGCTTPPAGPPLTPLHFDDVLRQFRSAMSSSSGAQEDAQEFLTFLLDRLHQELVEVSDHTTHEMPSSDEDVWETVGKGHKTSVTRTTQVVESPIHQIFGGQLRSAIRRPGAKESATCEPFMTLHLDIDTPGIRWVDEALSRLMASERLDDDEQDRTIKQLSLAGLPPTLILHLKRFCFTSRGVEKLHKHVAFKPTLEIHPRHLASSAVGPRHYDLLSVISHHGKSPIGGHYTCCVRHACGSWLEYDDSIVRPHKVTRRDTGTLASSDPHVMSADSVVTILLWCW